MSAVTRTLAVEKVEPGLSDPDRVHAVIAVRDGVDVDGTVHLFTSDPVLVACLVPGAEMELRAVMRAPVSHG